MPENTDVTAPAFTPTGMGLDIFNERYAKNGETWEEACRRVARAVAAAENGSAAEWEEKFYDVLANGQFMPGGRIWFGAGEKVQQLLNCVSGDTLVHTTEGLVEARTLEGRKVATLSDGGLYREADWYCYGEQELFRVVFANGDEVEATAAHEWVVTKPKGGTERVTTDALAGRRVPIQGRAAFVYDEESYLAGVRHGLVFGDGSQVSKNTAEMHQFGDSKVLASRYFDNVREVDRHPHVVGTSLLVSGLPSSYKRLPEGSEGESYLRGFIAGLIGADGHVDRRGHVMLHHADLDRLVEIRQLAASVGLPSTGIKMTREINPWSGARSPIYKLTFVKAVMRDERLIIKPSHWANMKSSPDVKKRQTMEVQAVLPTGRVEPVYCCVEPETHTMVVGPGYLTGQCFVVPADDSIEGWGKTISDVMTISARGGGVGVNASPVRGREYPISGMKGESTGSVSLMQMIDAVGNVLVGGGNRRLALMLCLDVDHPDIEEFLDKKLDQDLLNNANVSVVLPEDFDTEEFQRLVREDGEIPLMFNGLPDQLGERTIKARALWERLVENAWNSGEPGFLNGNLANKMNNIWYHKPLISTNPCGEIWLESYGCCCLGALVLPRFVKDGEFDWAEFDKVVRTGVRFLDDVLDVNHYPLPEIEKNCKEVRRIGLGVMGLHTLLLRLGMTYDSDEAFAFVDRLFEFKKNCEYDESSTLAAAKRPFPAYSPKLLESGFAQTLKPGIRAKIAHYGLRNCAMSTVAPTGTTAMVQADADGMTAGIEPDFAPAYYRRRITDMDKDGKPVYHTTLVISANYLNHPKTAQGAYDVHPRDHMRMQTIIQKHTDNAVSKTINLPADFAVEDLGELWLENLPYLKGCTLYRQGSRGLEPMEHIALEDVQRALDEWDGEVEYQLPQADDCVSGVCEMPWQTKESSEELQGQSS